jgi:hypothetical protein
MINVPHAGLSHRDSRTLHAMKTMAQAIVTNTWAAMCDESR